MQKIVLLTLLLPLSFGSLLAQLSPSLVPGFKNPPTSAYPKTYWWWLNGHVDTIRLKEELHAMHAAGLSGFDIFDIGVPVHDTVVQEGAPFLGDTSLQAIRVALELAKELGMTAGLSMASSWNAGGAWIQEQHAAKSIYFSQTAWRGEKRITLNFADMEQINPEGARHIRLANDRKPVYYEEVAVLAIPESNNNDDLDTSQIINVTSFFDPDTEELTWDHSGNYQIYRYICSNSGEQLKLPGELSRGPIIDHFDAAATEFHFRYVLDKLKTILPDGIESSALKSLYLASYEATGFTWTPTLPTAFARINGYSIYPFLPALFDPDIFPVKLTENFERDFRRTLSELMIDNFYRKAKEICQVHGLKINSESGGPGFPLHNVPVEPLKSLGIMDLPRGEFWINHNRLNSEGIDILRVVKEVSSASHIYGRGVVEEEAFTTFQHWQEGPFEMKPSGDRAFCEGMNKVVIHGSSHNPRGYGLPGIYYGAGTHFNDRRIWWSYVRPFTEYLARVSYIAQESDFVADVLYYYGDAVPNYAGHKNSRFMVGPGYDYEVINTEILTQLSTSDGMLELPTGTQFKMLVLEPEKEMHPLVLQKLKELAAAGTIIVGTKPESVAIRANLPELKFGTEDIDALWTEADDDQGIQVDEGKVWSGISPLDALRHLELPPDFTYSDAALFVLDYIHYQRGSQDFYFIRNTTNQWISRNCTFRQVNKTAEIWDPVDGDTEPCLVTSGRDEYMTLTICLPPSGSTFVVFSDLDGQYVQPQISFTPDQALPRFAIDHNELILWDDGYHNLTIDSLERTIINHPKTQELTGAWELHFPEDWGAPAHHILPELTSWTESNIEGIKYFSGKVTYEKTFQYDINSGVAENQRVYLDLGDLTNVAEVRLNDTLIGIAWAKPYCFEVTDYLKAGDNTLRIKVANTWNNRLNGDAVTGDHYTSTNITNTNVAGLNKKRLTWDQVPLIRAGLFGPVRLISVVPVQIDHSEP